jgi:hypothetical protein
MDRVSQRLASERMKVEAGKVQFLRCINDIEAIEPQQNPLMHLYVDLRRFAAQPQLAKRLIFECPDHAAEPPCDAIEV